MSLSGLRKNLVISAALLAALLHHAPLSAQTASPAQEDPQLDTQLQSIAQAHHGHLAIFAKNLKTGQTASVDADEPVQTASVIKLGILLDAAEQIRAGKAKFEEKLVLNKDNQVPGSGVLAAFDTPLAITLKDTLTMMVIVSDNTATNMAIDRLGLAHINETLRAAGLKQTVLYKKVYRPAQGPMPADQPKFGLGKTTAREMAQVMERFAECRLALDGSAPAAADGPICGAMLLMLRGQQDRDSLPRQIEFLDTSEQGSAIGDKIGALDQVRNDVAILSTKNGPVVVSAFTWDNADQRWNGDNEGEQTLGKVGKAIVERWSPGGLDAGAFNWKNPLADMPKTPHR